LSYADARRKNVIGDTFKSFKKEFRILVATIVSDLKRRGFLPNLHELDETDRTFINQILNQGHKAEVEAQALFRLTEILHILHKREVILLIDEYDTPTAYASQYGYLTKVRLHKA
jgi:hypothetical protein